MNERVDFDSPWKEVLERYFEQFIAFFAPHAYDDIDWRRGYVFLDKELQQLTRDSDTGRQIVDKLVKVWLKNGEEAWLLIHIEVQSQPEIGFGRRIFGYNCRLYDRFGREVVTIVVLADDDPKWRPTEYGYTRWGVEHKLRFLAIKLLDFAPKWVELQQNTNPFAIVVMAHLRAQGTRRKPTERLRWKLELVKYLYERGYRRDDVLELFRFIDWLLVLPENLEERFDVELADFEEKTRMQYVTSIERRAIKRGIEQGIEQGAVLTARDNVLELLSIRFQPIPEELTATINGISNQATLKHLLRLAVTTETLEEFERIAEETAASQ